MNTPNLCGSQSNLFELEPITGQGPIVVSYGFGVDSTAMLIGMYLRGQKPDLILHADTGSEKPSTYLYHPIMGQWLASVRFPPVTIVKYEPKNFKNWPPYYSLEQNCLTNGTLPSIAFGFSSCSLKWKVAPQDKYIKTWAPAIAALRKGQRIQRLIGYDAGPRDAKRYAHARTLQLDTTNEYKYPLVEWGWDREECKRQITMAGLPLPTKSACFFCTATKPEELHEYDRETLAKIVRMEARANPRLTTTEGLWRRSTKTRPGKMSDYIRDQQLLTPSQVTDIWANTPKDILNFQEGYATAKANGTHKDFVAQNPERDYRFTSPIFCNEEG